MLDRKPSEVWVEIHYRYKGETFRFNLPLPQGGKFLDGLRLDFDRQDFLGGRRFTVSMEPLGEVILDSFELTGGLDYGDDLKSVFVNGYQSWTGSRERSPGERISAINWPGKLLSLQKFGDSLFYNYSEKKGRFHGYTYAYTRFQDRFLFAGSLDESAGYTIIGTDIRHKMFSITKDVAGLGLSDRRQILDVVLLEGSEKEVFDSYIELRKESPCPGSRAAAWSSWHGYHQDINEVSIRKNLAEFRNRSIPLRYFIIDDGWQQVTGDWATPASGFPSGMSSLVAEIKGSGYIPGIRFAPFIVSGDSTIFRNHKDWIARDPGKRPRPAGRIRERGGFFYVLDISREDVRSYIADTIKRFRDEWGFGLIKMDMLYTAALYPARGQSRGEAMVKAMDFLQSQKGDAEYLASAVPLESAFGKVEYCRIGAETTPFWEHLYTRNIHCRERPSTLNNLRSTVGRRQLNGRFFSSETDSFFLKSGLKTMEPARRYTQLLLHTLLGNMITTSDNIGEFDEDELRTYLSQFPMIKPEIDDVLEFRRTVAIRYRVAGRSFISFSNLAERIRPFVLPVGPWFGAQGLKRRPHHVAGGGKQVLKPGESRNYMLLESGGVFAGSDGHIFPGCEVSGIENKDGDWLVTPDSGALNDFNIWIRVPDDRSVSINGQAADIVSTSFGEKFAKGTVLKPQAKGNFPAR